MAAANGAGATGLSLAPDQDSFIYVLKLADTEVVHIYSTPKSAYTPTSFEHERLPDILNGVTKNARLKNRVITGPDGSTRTVITLDSFKPNAETSGKYKRSGFGQWDRLGVKPHPSVATTQSPRVAQYSTVLPTAYSGRMAKLVQVLLGFGRVQRNETAGTVQERAEAANNGIQVQYDCRWHRCHILSTGADGRLWLVEISISRGVSAMLLPLYSKKPSADTPSMKAVVEEFGGLPTGQTFPTGKAFDEAVRAGTILRLATASDLKDFYSLQPFSSAMGWTTNTKGDEAHNTGWRFGEDNIRHSRHYRLKIRIGALKKEREPGEPIASGEAVLSMVSDGRFYHPSTKFPPPIKFYEPMIGGLMSVEMQASAGAYVSVAALTVCNTTMHVCYIGDELKLVKYFWDRTNIQARPKVDTNFETCMYIGAWYREEITPPIDYVPTFYTTDFDDRKQGEQAVYRLDVVGTEMGWSYHWGADSSIPYFPQWGSLWRDKQFRFRQVTYSTSSKYNAAAIVVPRGLRDGYVYALYTSRGSAYSTNQTYYRELRDPIAYQLYQYFYSSYKPKNGCWNQFGYKAYKELGPLYNECNEMIEEGSWRKICQDGEPAQGPSLPKGSFVSKETEPFHAVTPTLVTSSERGNIALKVTSGSYYDSQWDVWRSRSPDPETDSIQVMDASFSAIGTLHMAYDERINGVQTRVGPLLAGEGDGDYNYVGVP